MANSSRLLLLLPLLARVRTIPGWLEDAEVDALVAAATLALQTVEGEIVEIGSYCGKSTVALGTALRASGKLGVKVYAIDPHEGEVTLPFAWERKNIPTLERFHHSVADAGLSECVEAIVARSFEVEWEKPISLLFIDGLHDYDSVSRDFRHFERWLAPRSIVVFHDYWEHFPGVMKFVGELLAIGGYELIGQVLSTMIVRKRA
jgi:predicted O-methyltransferase YrrM